MIIIQETVDWKLWLTSVEKYKPSSNVMKLVSRDRNSSLLIDSRSKGEQINYARSIIKKTIRADKHCIYHWY